jgi:DNA-binding winged helix-turn-helix (wHTH) protein/WD40 repeat protein
MTDNGGSRDDAPAPARGEDRALEEVSQPQRDELRSFRVGEWLVEPSLNRLSRVNEVVRLDLKSMDLLRCLAEDASEVISTQELVDRVWQVEVVAVGTLTHAVAELRKALGDDARSPSYIETIPKRGYRLIAKVSFDVVDEPRVADIARFPVPVGSLLADEERNPYPGLATFTEANAEFFFGREAEVAQLWRKLLGRRLLAVIGPSGVGKSSFVRAGVIPAALEGWGVVVCQPGEAPLASLARTLVPEFAGDQEAIEGLVGLSDPDGAVAMISRWRERHEWALLVVDQFEELFTLCPLEVQRSFAGLLRRLVQEVGVHVLIVMRDDFLYRCHELPPLGPIFDGLTPLAQPSGAALRRALTEPAARLGFTFEGDLAHEMVAEVRDERGALPLLAFAVARLWDKRDREGRSLTRAAYLDIGGVGGALARNAEATLSSIGTGRLPIAREIFRNLVTAEGTRAVREFDELVGIFHESERGGARTVLRYLIDARLLTSFEEELEEKVRHHRVEVVHESLLTAWPRLVAWQTQDADSARLRDDLRQAARMWHDHGRQTDRLWTGTAYAEFVPWRDRYPGRLTEIEQEFAHAMTAHAGRRRRRRRMAVTAGLSILLIVLAVVTTLWRKSVVLFWRAEAQKLVAVGRNQLDDDATAALAYATASLEIFDTSEARRLAVEALWRGPPVSVLETGPDLGAVSSALFTPEGRFLVASSVATDEIFVWSDSGRFVTTLGDGSVEVEPHAIGSDPTGKILLDATQNILRVWSVPEFELVQDLGPEDGWVVDEESSLVSMTDRRLLETTPDRGGELIRWLPLDGGEREHIGRWGSEGIAHWRVGVENISLYFTRGREIVRRPLDSLESAASDQVVARHPGNVSWFSLSSSGQRIAAIDDTGDIRIWATDPNPLEPLRILRGPEATFFYTGAPAPGGLGSLDSEGNVRMRDIAGPPDAAPRVFRRPALTSGVYWVQIGPSARWVASFGIGRFTFRPVAGPYPYVLKGHAGKVSSLAFSGDGSRLVSASHVGGTLRLWPLSSESLETGRVIWDRSAGGGFTSLATDETGDRLLVTTATSDGGAYLLPVAEGGAAAKNLWPDLGSRPWGVTFDPDGRRAAAGAAVTFTGEDMMIRIWDLETGDEQTLALRNGSDVEEWGIFERGVIGLHFTPEGGLLSCGTGGIRLWNLETGEAEWLMQAPEETKVELDASKDGRVWLTAEAPSMETILNSNLRFHDRTTGTTRALTSHGRQIAHSAIDPTGTIVVTGDADGVIRVGRTDGSEPYLLMGHEGEIGSIAARPAAQRAAGKAQDPHQPPGGP